MYKLKFVANRGIDSAHIRQPETTTSHFHTISPASRFLIYQGILYTSFGLLTFFFPHLSNKLLFFPAPFTIEETVWYRAIGLCGLVQIGSLYIMTSRFDHLYWIYVTTLTRMTTTPALLIILWLIYDGPMQVCITFFIADPILALMTFYSLKKNEKSKGLALLRGLNGGTSLWRETLIGANILPPFGSISPTCKFLVLQGIMYIVYGSIIVLLPHELNKFILYVYTESLPIEWSNEVIPLVRTIGICIVIIGIFYTLTSRANIEQWPYVTIFTKMVIIPSFLMILVFVYDGHAQTCVGFALYESFIAFLTYLSMQGKEKKNN